MVLVGAGDISVSQWLINLTMVQTALGVDDIDIVYWTLFLEIAFYVLIFILLLMRLGRWLHWFFVFWALVLLASHFAGWGQKVYLGGFYAFFCAGGLFAAWKKLPAFVAILALGVVFYLCLDFSVWRAEKLSGEFGRVVSPVVVSAVLAVFFGLFGLLLVKTVAQLQLPAARKMGQITYPLYLLHAGVGYPILNRFASEAYYWELSALLAVAMIGLAWGLSHLIEVRYAFVWRQLFDVIVRRPVAYFT